MKRTNRIFSIALVIILAVLMLTGCTEPECPNCGDNVSGLDEHQAACKKTGHYTCDGLDHTRGCVPTAPCGIALHAGQDPKLHALANCKRHNHYICDRKSHTLLSCGNADCQMGHDPCRDCSKCSCTHVAAQCGIKGHAVCGDQVHGQAAECGFDGHYTCDGQDHESLMSTRNTSIETFCPIHPVCAPGDHSLLECGCLACAGGDHSKLPCGHHACTGGDHSAAPCGQHYACNLEGSASDHNTMDCGHCTSISAAFGHGWSCAACGQMMCHAESAHSSFGCGWGDHYYCATTGTKVGGDYAHEELACGYHSDCDGRGAEGHAFCAECYQCILDCEHGGA